MLLEKNTFPKLKDITTLADARQIITDQTSSMQNLLFWLLLFLGNIAIWIPMLFRDFPTIGLGIDNQLFIAAINSALREGNMPWDLMVKILGAREDIFSTPHFGILYPFYWTLGFNSEFSYTQNLLLDFSSVMFHMVIASITFALLLKRMNCRYDIAVIFGLFYAYSLHLKMWSSWLWAISGYSWIPLCLLGVWECVAKNNYRLGIICLGTGFGFIALGTSLPLVYALILSAALFFACILDTKPSLQKQLKIYSSILMGGLIAVFVGASHLLPTLYRMTEYIRWYSGGAIVGGLKPPYEGTLSAVLDFNFATFTQLIVPTNWNGGLAHLYLGSTVLVLFAYFLYKNRSRLFIWPLLLVAIYFLFDAFGDATIVHRITYRLPLVNSIRYPAANVFIPLVVILMLSAMGLTQLLNEYKSSTKHTCKNWLIVLAVICIASVLYQYQHYDQLIRPFKGDQFWLLVIPAFISISMLVIIKFVPKHWLAWFPIILLTSQLIQNSMLFHPKIPEKNSLYLMCDAFMELHQELRKTRQTIDGAPRLVISTSPNFRKTSNSCLKNYKTSSMLLQSVALMSGWDVQEIYLSPRPLKEFRLFHPLSYDGSLNQHDKLLHAGITHVLTDTAITAQDPRNQFYTYVRPIGEFSLYVIKDHAVGGPNIGCINSLKQNAIFTSANGSRKIKVDGNPVDLSNTLCTPDVTGNNQIDHIELTEINRLASTIRYQIKQDKPSLFISDQVYSPDWHTSINGKTLKPFLIDRYRLAVQLPAGEFTLKLKYSPLDLRIGVFMTYLGLFCLLIIIIIPRLKKSLPMGLTT